MAATLRGKPPSLKVLCKAFHGADVFAGPGCPARPRREKAGRLRPCVGIVAQGCVLDPRGEGVLCLQIFGCGFEDCVGRPEANLLPTQATLDRPRQDAGPFLLEPFGERLVALVGRNGYGERYEVEPAADRFIDRSKCRACDYRR